MSSQNLSVDDDDIRLDHAACELRQYRDLYIYRGGSHIAIHFKDAEGHPLQHRVAIITKT